MAQIYKKAVVYAKFGSMKKEFGKIKLTVGVLKGSRQKVQYCITAIDNG